MDPKHSLLSTVGLGVGVGLGLTLGYAKSWTRSSSASLSQFELLETELINQIIDGKAEASSTFDSFPYYLNERTKVLLITTGYAHLRPKEFFKLTKNLLSPHRTILLTGPPDSEPYFQSLAKALAHHYDAKLLLLDISDFVTKIQRKTGTTKFDPEPRSFTEYVSDALCQVTTSLSTLTANSPKVSAGRAKTTASNSDSNTAESGSPVSDKPSEVPRLRRTVSLGGIDERTLVDALFKVVGSISQTSRIILYLRDVEDLLARSSKLYPLLMKRIKELSGPVLILGSLNKIQDDNEAQQPEEKQKWSAKVECLFDSEINIQPPEDQTLLLKFQTQLDDEMKVMRAQDSRNHIQEVLAAKEMDCDDLNSICFPEVLTLSEHIEEVLVSVIGHHLMNAEELNYRAGKLLISASSLTYGLELLQGGGRMKTKLQENSEETTAKADAQGTTSGTPDAKPEMSALDVATSPTKTETPTKADGEKKGTEAAKPAAAKPEVAPDNEFEKRIRPEVIPAGEVGVSFDDIGALEDIKESLQELVMLPLRRPELFSRGGLIKPCRGILLFGPPGTGKTMLAKAVATEAGASFINVSMSSITSKWFGEDEKNVRALFTLAGKVSPTIIFIDEVDSMLGQRSRVGEHEAMRKIKNEFMAHWDGLLSKPGERILVLAATNRPFDLDDAIIRRFERRIMVGLPDASNREKILRAILSKESLSDDFDFKELASMTEGYSGSDLKNFCMAAAYRPVRELLKNEKQKKIAETRATDAPKPGATEENKPEAEDVSAEMDTSNASDTSVERDTSEKSTVTEKETSVAEPAAAEEISFRPLNMEDMKEARKQISASFSAEGAGMAELQEWNELYGEGGSRKKQPLSYFL